jgi:hypothetical protein
MVTQCTVRALYALFDGSDLTNVVGRSISVLSCLLFNEGLLEICILYVFSTGALLPFGFRVSGTDAHKQIKSVVLR